MDNNRLVSSVGRELLPYIKPEQVNNSIVSRTLTPMQFVEGDESALGTRAQRAGVDFIETTILKTGVKTVRGYEIKTDARALYESWTHYFNNPKVNQKNKAGHRKYETVNTILRPMEHTAKADKIKTYEAEKGTYNFFVETRQIKSESDGWYVTMKKIHEAEQNGEYLPDLPTIDNRTIVYLAPRPDGNGGIRVFFFFIPERLFIETVEDSVKRLDLGITIAKDENGKKSAEGYPVPISEFFDWEYEERLIKITGGKWEKWEQLFPYMLTGGKYKTGVEIRHVLLSGKNLRRFNRAYKDKVFEPSNDELFISAKPLSVTFNPEFSEKERKGLEEQRKKMAAEYEKEARENR